MFSLTRQAYSALFILSLLCGLGYYFALPFLEGLDFVFGSIATLLIIHLFGVRWAVPITLIASSYTLILWGHPYGMIAFTLEALFIGLVWQRFSDNLLLLEGIFWLCIGVPVMLVLNATELNISPQPLDDPDANTDSLFNSLFLLKIMVNSAFNSAVANLMILHLPLNRWLGHYESTFRPTLRQIITNIIVAFALLISLVDIIINTQRVVYEVETQVMQNLNTLTNNISNYLTHVHGEHMRLLQSLAQSLGQQHFTITDAAQQNIQLGLELFPNLLEIKLLDTNNQVLLQRYQPRLVDKSCAVDYSPSEYVKQLQAGKITDFVSTLTVDGTPQAIIVYVLPIQMQGQVVGALFAHVQISAMQQLKVANEVTDDIELTLLDKQLRTVSTSRHDDLGLFAPYDRFYSAVPIPFPTGHLLNAPKYHTYSVWEPSNIHLPDLLRWQQRVYIQRYDFYQDIPNVPLIAVMEVSFKPYAQTMQHFYSYKLATIAVILLCSLILAMIITNWLIKPIVRLGHITRDLAGRIESRYRVDWPHSQVSEIDSLTHNFKAMASSLHARFEELQQARALLAERVQQRTAELAHERALLRNLVDSIPDLIFYKDCNGIYLGGNKAFERFSERPLTELIGRTDNDLFSVEQADVYYQRDRKVLISQLPMLTEEHFQDPQHHQKVLMEVLITPFFDDNQQILGLIGVCRDITARRYAEQQLLRSQNMLRLVMDTIPQYIFWKDLHGTYLGCNRNYAHIVGLSAAEDIIGKIDRDLAQIQPTDSVFFATLQAFINANDDAIYQQTQALQLDNGMHMWLEISKVPLCDEQAGPLGTLVSFEDITERKRVDDKLRQAAKVLENSAEAICITDAEVRIILVNKTFTDITGYHETEVMGQRPTLLKSGKHSRDFYKRMWRSILETGHWEGEIWNRRKNGEVYPEWLHITVIKDETGNITNYLAIFSDITVRKQTEERLAFLAHYDDLTGLPNRTLFYERVNRAIHHAQRQSTKVALMFMDLDRFKYVNDTWGHAVGDMLLKDVASRLVECIRKSDTLARLGGDEFTAVLENINSSEDAAMIADNMLVAMQPAFHLNGYETFMTTSMGISLYPDDGHDVESLLKNADAAMYRAKEGGKNNYQFFTTQMNVQAHQRLVMETQLRHALERDEFLLYYQPQMHIASGHIVGVEVLLRWQHPERGLVSPYEFIPLAEETGLIVPIGEWVLKHACQQHRYWRISGYPILRLSVNVSSRQFREQAFINNLINIVDTTDMDPHLLELELTESILIQDADMASHLLQALKRMGIQLAIDDFGTGYSSLSYLKRFPIDKLKIDQAFIRDIPNNPEDMMITRAIVALAQSLRLQVIAEGVETRQQMAFLKSLKCDEVQGFLVGHPLPAADFLRLLD